MILTDEKAIDKAIAGGEVPSLVFLYGEEEHLKREVLMRLMEGDGFSSFNDVRLDFAQFDADTLEEAVTTLPLMASHRSVLLFDVVPKDITADLFKRLEKIFASLDETCRLILLEKSGAVDAKRDEKSKKLLKLADKYGCVFELRERSVAVLQKLVRAEAEKRGCTLSPAAAKALTERAGQQTGTLLAEVEKLCALHDYDGEIEAEDVERLTPQRPEDNIYGLSKAILRGDYAGSMRILGDLFYLRYPPESILSVLSGFYVDLYRAKAAVAAKKASAQVAADFGYGKRTFAVDNAVRDQRRLSEKGLVRALDTLGRADLRLKSTQCDARIVLEETVTALFAGEDGR